MGVFGRLKKRVTSSTMDMLPTESPPETPRSLRGSPFSRVFTPRSFRSSRKQFDSGFLLSPTTSPVSNDDPSSSKQLKDYASSPVTPVQSDKCKEIENTEIVHHSVTLRSNLSPAMRAIEARTFAASPVAESTTDNSFAGSDPESRDGLMSPHAFPDRPHRKRTIRSVTSFLSRKYSSAGSGGTASNVDLSEHWLIDIEDIVIGRTIGHSSFGTVNQGMFNGTKVAVKTIHHDSSPNSQNNLASIRREAELNCKLRHPNIVLFMGICIQPNTVSIVTELMARGNVRDLLLRKNEGHLVRLDWNLRQQWALDTARGMTYLHSLDPPMIHRDLKTNNLLVDRGMNVKICDFGLSRFRSEKMMSSVGTIHFAAPEVLRSDLYNEKADLFSFGTVMWELYARKCVFDGLPQIVVFQKVMSGDMPPVGSDCDDKYRQLMMECWSVDIKQRPSFREVTERLSVLVGDADDLSVSM